MAAAMLTTTEIAGVVGAALAGVAYVPQLSRLIGSRCSVGISMLAQEVWLAASLLTTARAIAIHAGVFVVLGGTQIVSTALIMVLVTRYRDRPCPSPCVSHQSSAETDVGTGSSARPIRHVDGQPSSPRRAPSRAR
jgi:hypothetical protein